MYILKTIRRVLEPDWLELKHFACFLQASAGPPKKGKPSSAAGGKTKKTSDNQEITETELSVSFQIHFSKLIDLLLIEISHVGDST